MNSTISLRNDVSIGTTRGERKIEGQNAYVPARRINDRLAHKLVVANERRKKKIKMSHEEMLLTD